MALIASGMTERIFHLRDPAPIVRAGRTSRRSRASGSPFAARSRFDRLVAVPPSSTILPLSFTVAATHLETIQQEN